MTDKEKAVYLVLMGWCEVPPIIPGRTYYYEKQFGYITYQERLPIAYLIETTGKRSYDQ